MSLLITKQKLKVIFHSILGFEQEKISKPYELPDGKILQVKSQQFRCPEALFKPLSMGK